MKNNNFKFNYGNANGYYINGVFVLHTKEAKIKYLSRSKIKVIFTSEEMYFDSCYHGKRSKTHDYIYFDGKEELTNLLNEYYGELFNIRNDSSNIVVECYEKLINEGEL